MKVYQFGLLGCGTVAPLHADAIASLSNAKLRGVVSASAAKAEAFAARYETAVYESYESMLQDPLIDAVCICTPSMLHAEQAVKALRHGKHVVLEKPMALNTAEADAILQACQETGCKLTTVFQNRFSEDVAKVKLLLAQNAFGTISAVNLMMHYWRDESYFHTSNWKGKLSCEGGGALMNQGIHGIDLLIYLMGMPEVLSSCVNTLVHDVEVEDSASALIRFENGASGLIQGSTCTWPGFPRKLEIHGDEGFVVLRENRIEQLETDAEKIDLRGQFEGAVKSYQRADVNEFCWHAVQITNLLDAVEGKAQLLIDAEEGRKSLEILEEIYRLGR